MTHGDGSLSRTVHAVSRIGIHTTVTRQLHILQIIIAKTRAKINILWLFITLYIKHHCGVLGLDNNLLGPYFCGRDHENR